MRPVPAPHGPDSLSLSLFSCGILKTKEVCHTDQLFLCRNLHVAGL